VRALALVVSIAGCSFSIVRTPPPPCTQSYAAPIADTVLAGLAAGATVLAIEGQGGDSPRTDATFRDVLLGGYAVTAVAAIASAAYGYYEVSSCRDVSARAR